MKEKPRVPQKGAGRKWAQKLKELGQQSPPQGLVDKINQAEKKKVAVPRAASKDLDV